jgi:hypothetical protein
MTKEEELLVLDDLLGKIMIATQELDAGSKAWDLVYDTHTILWRRVEELRDAS